MSFVIRVTSAEPVINLAERPKRSVFYIIAWAFFELVDLHIPYSTGNI
jgi:hypothetical protein